MTQKFLQLAQTGQNQWWRYLLAISFILFSWLVIGSIPTAILIFSVNADDNPQTQFNLQNSQFSGVDALSSYLVLNLSYVIFMIALYVGVKFIHKRRFITLVTPRNTVSWRRIFQGFSLYFIVSAIGSFVEAIVYPGTYQLTFDSSKFLVLLPLALIFTPIQTSVEELFVRGYLMQGIGLKTRRAIIPILLSSILFMLPHLGNPEVASNFLLLAIYYFILGLFLAIITIKDNTLELALGIHAANNLFIVLIANYSNSALPSPSIFSSKQLNPVYNIVSFLLIVLIFYWVFFRKRSNLQSG